MSLRVFPNPATCYAVIRAPEPGTGLELLDVSGHQVLVRPLSGRESRISLAGVRPGVYFCRVQTARGALAARLLVAR